MATPSMNSWERHFCAYSGLFGYIFGNIFNFWFQMFRMLLFLLLLWLLPPTEGSQRAEPMFTAVTSSVLPPDYDSNPTQLNYGVAVTDVDHDGDFEIVVAG